MGITAAEDDDGDGDGDGVSGPGLLVGPLVVASALGLTSMVGAGGDGGDGGGGDGFFHLR